MSDAPADFDRRAERSHKALTRIYGTTVALWTIGGLLIGWGAMDSRFRDAEGFLVGTVVLPVAAGIGLLLLGCAWRSSLRRSVLWLGLALVGAAAALMLITAGPQVRYQHYMLPRPGPAGPGWLPAALIVTQGIAVTWAGRPWLGRMWGHLRQLPSWRIALALLLFVLPSAVLSRNLLTYVGELLIASAIQAICVANLFLVLAALPSQWRRRLSAAAGRLIGRPGSEANGPRLDRFVLAAAGGAAVLAILLGWLSYEHHPHVPDEVTYLMQARYLAMGTTTLPVPPVPEAFHAGIMSYDGGRWFSPMPPGWPALLMLGTETNLAWLINPLLAAIGICLAYLLLTDLYDRRIARVAVLLLALSPWHIFLSMSFMNHPATLTVALLAAVPAARFWRSGRARWALFAGAGIGLLSLIRPLDAVALAGTILAAWTVAGWPALHLKPSVLFLTAAAIVGSIILPYNEAVTGSATEMPLASYAPPGQESGSNALGFGKNRGWGWTGLDPLPGHGPLDAAINTAINTALINVELFGWGTGSLILLIGFLLLARCKGADRAMLGALGLIAAAHSTYWFHGGPDFGARYWYLMIVPLIALSARGIDTLNEQALASDSSERDFPEAASIGAGLLCLIALATFVPWRAIDKYHHYRGMRPGAIQAVEEHGLGRSLVLVEGDAFPDYASASVYNPLDFEYDGPVFAWDGGTEMRRRLAAAFPDRPIWIMQGPTVSGSGYRLNGPLESTNPTPQQSSVGCLANEPGNSD